jgi:hypothetical protein
MKTSKQKLFLILFSIIFCSIIVFSAGSQPQSIEIIGCCVSPDYGNVLNTNESYCNDIIGWTFFEQLCENIPYFNVKGCCVKNLQTEPECSYSTQAWCQYNEGNFFPNIEKNACGNNENSWGACSSQLSTENCTTRFGDSEICIEGTIFYCDKNTGKLIPNCNLCKNCAPFACDSSTGKCDLTNTESEFQGEISHCCYFEEQCPQGQRNSTLECSSEKPIGCNVECRIFPCKLNFQINSSVNKQTPLCWCGNTPYNTSSDIGYCCGEDYENSYYLNQTCGSAVGKIFGYIKNSTGFGIKDARVIVKSSLYQRLSSASTSMGYYEIKDLLPGEYSLIATAFGYNIDQKSINLIDVSEVNFTLLKPGEQGCGPESVNLTFFSAEPVKGKPFVKLSWTLNKIGCEDEISSFIIKRDDWSVAKHIPSNVSSFIDEETSWDTTYNYEIGIIFVGGSVSNILEAEITTGDSVCENVFEGEEFCYNPNTEQKKGDANHRRTCDENNKISEYVSNAPNAGKITNCEDFNSICIVLKDKKTDCKPKSNCLIKGLPLGLFFNIPLCLQDFCVYDYSTTNVDACLDCTKFEGGLMFLKSCYDFNSEFACQNNNCNLNCTWKYTNLELSKGICYPKEEVEGESNCDVCNQLFMHCTSQDCSLLGHCYKNKDSYCVDCNGVRCEDFVDEFSCEGDNSLIEAECSAVNTCPSPRYSSDNSLIEAECGFKFSNDACDLRICKWDSTTNSCFKDGNYDGKPDCAGKQGSFYELCINDTQPPTFDISAEQPANSLYISNEEDEIEFNSKENIIEFLYCFDTTNTCCPEKPLTISKNKNVVFKPKIDEKTYIEQNGNNIYYFRYKAQDTAYNIAPVESIPMYVQAHPFDINLTYAFSPNQDNTYDLLILVNTSEYAKCRYQLSPDIDSSLNKTTFYEYSNSFMALFTGITETSYNLIIRCLSSSNIFEKSFTISYVKDAIINITINTPYYQDSIPIVSWGNWIVELKALPGVNIRNVSVYISKGGNRNYLKNLKLESFDPEENISTYTLTLNKDSDTLARDLRENAGLFVVDAVYNEVKVTPDFINGKEFAIYTGLPEPQITIS